MTALVERRDNRREQEERAYQRHRKIMWALKLEQERVPLVPFTRGKNGGIWL
jgi:hypothetical protein